MIANESSVINRVWDVCVVGAGPIGMTVALECETQGLNTLLLESGPLEDGAKPIDDTDFEIVCPERHASMALSTCSGFGGTSRTWGGRCVPFDDIDFETRPHMPYSGWPISHEDVKRWYGPAVHYLNAGNDTFVSQPSKNTTLGPAVSILTLERWSAESRLALIHRDRITRSQRIALCLNTTVVDLDIGENGIAVERIVAVTLKGRFSFMARRVVLAAGGVQTTRLLLSIQRRCPRHFGGIDGPLGRYYMGHISGRIADLKINDPAIVNDLDFCIESDQTYVRRRFTLSSLTQDEHRLFNIAFWIDNAPFRDPTHHSGALSAIFLGIQVPSVGRLVFPEGIRRSLVGPKPHRISSHFWNIISDVPQTAKIIARLVKNRFWNKPRIPGFLIRTRNSVYGLCYHAEQAPNPDSRIVLTSNVDRLGVPGAKIDLRFTNSDFQSVVNSHRILDSALLANEVGNLRYSYPETQVLNYVDYQASDGYHQIGSTRMGNSPKESVVDPNLKVHGVANLYVASTSVFPTGGQANPTLLGVALGIRLAHHLRESCTA